MASTQRSLVGRAKAALSRRSGASGDSSETSAATKKTATTTKPAAKKATTTKPAAKKTAATKTATKAPAKAPSKAATKAPAPKASAKKSPAKQTAAKTATKAAKKTVAKKSTTKVPAEKTAAAKAPAQKTATKKTAAKKTATKKTAATDSLVVLAQEDPWSKAELSEVRTALQEDVARLTTELAEVEGDLADMIASSDGAGQDQADVGSATFERDQELTIVFNARDMLQQSRHALERIDDGTYGVCEICGNPIGKNRLMAFPRATLCMTCKQREERR